MNESRELWLSRAAFLLRADLYPIAQVPQRLRVVHGLPDTYAAKDSETIGGVCFDNSSVAHPRSYHFAARIHISSNLDFVPQVLEVLVHELVHSSVGCVYGHGMEFEKPARDIGLEGWITRTHRGPELATRLREISIKLGTYPGEIV